jgi:molybdopterin-binding protein
MKPSARNQMPGTMKVMKPGATATHVKIEVSPTVAVSVSITNEAARVLGLRAGVKATAVIWASNVMVGV